MEKAKVRIINEKGEHKFVTASIGNNEKLLKSYGWKKEEVKEVFIEKKKESDEDAEFKRLLDLEAKQKKKNQTKKDNGIKGNN